MTIDLDRLVHEPSAFDGQRKVVVVAHPDDEVLGCGIFLSRQSNAVVVHVTDGAPRDRDDATRLGFGSVESYAEARRRELEAAMALAGLAPDRLLSLDCPDQGASAALASLATRLAPILRGAAAVLTHAYEGGHPDHDATAFAVHHAVRSLGRDAPVLIEMPFYRASADGWLRQVFEPLPGAAGTIELALSDEEKRLKARMVDAHASQAGVLADFPIEAERFRLAPDYDFTRLPNGGLLLYERFGWGTTGAQWLAHVAAAQIERAP